MDYQDNKTIVSISQETQELGVLMGNQIDKFVSTAAPYMLAEDNISELIDTNTSNKLSNYQFFVLKSCTTEEVDDLAQHINDKIEKLFTALYSLKCPILYGVVSRNGKSNIVLGFQNQEHKAIAESMIKGLLIGVDIQDCEPDYLCFKTDITDGRGGIVSVVPSLKVEERRQVFDLSTLLRSMNGQIYTVLFSAKPISLEETQSKYNEIVRIRDVFVAVSKRSVSRQESANETKTVTNSMAGRGFVSEAIHQIRKKKFSFRDLLDSVEIGSRANESNASTETITGLSESMSYDVQNGMALEMIGYCDKAIERLKQAQSSGLWNVTISYASSSIGSDIIYACLNGELAKPSTDILPARKFNYYLKGQESIYLPNEQGKKLYAPITSAELGMLCTPPAEAVPDFEIKKGKTYPMISSNGEVSIGKVSDGQRALDNMSYSLSEKDLNKHTFVCGITGSGKTTTVKEILKNCSKPFMVIESAKKEYRNIVLPDERQKPIVYTLGKPEINCFQINPFYVQCGINLQTHIDFLKDLFNASFSFYGPMPYILEKCLLNIYKLKGWNLTLGYHPMLINTRDKTNIFNYEYMQAQYGKKAAKYLFPTMQDLKDEIKRYIENEMQYEGEVAGNIKTAILARLESLCGGAKGFMFNTNAIPNMEEIMTQNVVFELEGLADDSDKAFGVGLLIVFINEYRQVVKEAQNVDELRHLLVIEEAHRLLKNVSTEKSSEESANPKGKAVEHFTNMIAEMRSYGQGVIVAEQIPSKLSQDVIKNSSNKIIQRVVSADDQNLIANTIGMTPDESIYLGSLKTGVALCHKEGMSQPVFVIIPPPKKEPVISDAKLHSKNIDEVFDEIDYAVIRDNISEQLPFLSLKVINTLLAAPPQETVDAIDTAINQMQVALKKKDIDLINCKTDSKSIYARVLAERVASFFACGVYSFKNFFAQDSLLVKLFSAFETRCVEEIASVQEKLSKANTGYGESCKNRCAKIIAFSVKHSLCEEMDLLKTIDEYFFATPSGFSEKVIEQLDKKSVKGDI